MSLKRRQFLMFLGATAGTTALGSLGKAGENSLGFLQPRAASASLENLKFQPLQGPMPYEGAGLDGIQQATAFSRYTIQDDLVLPEGYTYDVIGAWGEVVGDSRFGYNNDYLSFVPTGENEGYLTINFEYISGQTWMQTYTEVVGKSLPFAEVIAAVTATEGEIDAFALPEGDPLKAQIMEISKEGLIDLGIGVIAIRQERDGRWVRAFSRADRRITGISGLEDERYLQTTGPAVAVFTKTNKLGYDDGLGANIIGSFQNCSGGTTPWGTALSAEENFQSQVPEAVMPDGSAFDPADKPALMAAGDIEGFANVLGLAGNKYGWMVEVDPANENDYGTKHTWLGRFRHEAVGVRAVEGQPLAVYSGCDRRGGHVYKFVSAGTVSDPTDKANSSLMADGMLYAAKFYPDGTGEWIALMPDTAVNPDMPSSVAGGMITLPQRPEGGWFKADSDAAATAFKQQYSTLGDLYEGNATEKQGAILIDAHYAANAAGATNTARPEDTDLAADGSLYIAFTSGSPGGDGGPSNSIFQGPNGETPYEYGWITKLVETDSNPGAMTFTWEMLALGGEPAEGGMGFANPDNLEIDANSNIWMVTDMSTSKHNLEVASRVDEEGSPVSQSNLRGLFGNNSIWYLPTSGPNAGEAYMFGYGPMECEMTGPFLTTDQTTLFLAAQHPGEVNGTRQGLSSETRQFAMKTTDGADFMQARQVPLGSNWPTKQLNVAPRPAVVAVRRLDGETLV